jgi:hypothetical protein
MVWNYTIFCQSSDWLFDYFLYKLILYVSKLSQLYSQRSTIIVPCYCLKTNPKIPERILAAKFVISSHRLGRSFTWTIFFYLPCEQEDMIRWWTGCQCKLSQKSSCGCTVSTAKSNIASSCWSSLFLPLDYVHGSSRYWSIFMKTWSPFEGRIVLLSLLQAVHGAMVV